MSDPSAAADVLAQSVRCRARPGGSHVGFDGALPLRLAASNVTL